MACYDSEVTVNINSHVIYLCIFSCQSTLIHDLYPSVTRVQFSLSPQLDVTPAQNLQYCWTNCSLSSYTEVSKNSTSLPGKKQHQGVLEHQQQLRPSYLPATGVMIGFLHMLIVGQYKDGSSHSVNIRTLSLEQMMREEQMYQMYQCQIRQYWMLVILVMICQSPTTFQQAKEQE